METLEARRVQAAGVMGKPVALPAQIAGEPISTPDLSTLNSSSPPGRPVGLVILRATTRTPLVASRFAATVDWGDGSPVDPAIILAQSKRTLVVEGPDHTYAEPGNHPIAVAVTEPGHRTPVKFRTSVQVSFGVDGAIALSSLNHFQYGGETTTSTPTFTGTTLPGAQVVVQVVPQNAPRATPIVAGFTTADAAGNWSVTTQALPPGDYAVSAQATSTNGVATTNPLQTSLFNVNNILTIPPDATPTATGSTSP